MEIPEWDHWVRRTLRDTGLEAACGMSIDSSEMTVLQKDRTEVSGAATTTASAFRSSDDPASPTSLAAEAAAIATAVAIAADADAELAAQALADAQEMVSAAAKIAAEAAARSQEAAAAAAVAAEAERQATTGVAEAVAAATAQAITAASCARAAARAMAEGNAAVVRLAETQVTHQVLHDHLTGLPNLALIRDRLTQALARATRSGTYVGVLFLDLDDFKGIHDRIGRDAADDVLVGVAGRLRECLRAGDTAGRLGGDEFVIVCEGLTDPAAAVLVAARVEVALGAALHSGGHSVRVRTSMGIATGEGTVHPAKLLRDADAAMLRAKGAGKGCYKIAEAIETRPFNLQAETW